MDWLVRFFSHGWAAGLAMAIASLLGAWIVEVVVIGLARRFVARTKTDLDDKILEALRRPIYFSLLLLGLDYAVHLWGPSQVVVTTTRSISYTIAILVWSVALMRLSGTLLKERVRKPRPGGLLQTRTLPLFDILTKTGVLAAAIYLAMQAWHVDVGAWLASAGVVGVAVGLAAQDSLSNYFAGVFIIADAPYKLRDVITLDDGTRGTVTDIGLRFDPHPHATVRSTSSNSILVDEDRNRSGGARDRGAHLDHRRRGLMAPRPPRLHARETAEASRTSSGSGHPRSTSPPSGTRASTST
ncbi:MAG: mechanosensitive ion channel family protein [Sandaracinaceae bacterium]